MKFTLGFGGNLKSDVSNLLNLWKSIYKDALSQCSELCSDSRDIDYVVSRTKQEGLSFLTITLPEFAKDLEQALAGSRIEPCMFRSFRKTQSIPSFLKGMMSILFDSRDGRLYEHDPRDLDAHSTIIDSIRQICLAFKKVEMDCTPNRVNNSIQAYVQVEHEFSSFTPSDLDITEFSNLCSVLWRDIISPIQVNDIKPHHGPGATADRLFGNQKYDWGTWTDRLEIYFPFLGNAISISANDSRIFQNLEYVSEAKELPVRVIPVPKTMKGPRIIAAEPCCMQYIQQGIKDVLVKRISTGKLTSGHVNFSDQTINQQLALSSSENGALATIDLKDASDRVPLSLVSHMFNSNPDLWDAILSCRSHSAVLPDGTIVPELKKFASMGSALCFPIEAMYFYTICVASLLEAENLPCTWRNVYNISRQVYVYGDDILVPSKHALSVLSYLQKYNCKVNSNKTFITGKFRESCGVDAYDGKLVTPTYVRKLPPLNRQDSSSIISWVATANLFYKRGYWTTCSVMFNMIERTLGFALPYVADDSPGLGRHTFMGYRTIGRYNHDLHRPEVRTLVACPVFKQDKLDGYPALWKYFIQSPRDEDIDKEHLQRSALHGTVTLKSRWVPVD